MHSVTVSLEITLHRRILLDMFCHAGRAVPKHLHRCTFNRKFLKVKTRSVFVFTSVFRIQVFTLVLLNVVIVTLLQSTFNILVFTITLKSEQILFVLTQTNQQTDRIFQNSDLHSFYEHRNEK